MTTTSFEHEQDVISENSFEEISEAFTSMPDSLKSFYISDVLSKRVKGVSVVNAWQLATNYFNSFPQTEQGIEDSTVRHRLMPDFVRSLNVNLSSETAHNFFNAAHVVIDSGDSVAKTRLAETLRRHFTDFTQDFSDSQLEDEYRNLVFNPEILGRFGDFFDELPSDEEYDLVGDMGDEEEWGRPIDEDKYVPITTPEGVTFLERRDEKECEEFLDYILNGVGVEMRDKAKDVWAYFGKEKRICTGENLKIIAYLEKEHPGAAHLLNGFYGIRNFARYSEQMLIDQYEKHGNADNPYGVVVSATADMDGAYRDYTRIGAASRQLKTETPYDMRVVEASDSIDLVRQLSRLHKLYGQKQKFSFMIMRGHGTPESIVLSDSLSQTMKGLATISLGNRLAAAEKWFVDSPLIVLQSCSTGKDDGIGQKISNELHAMVIAPDEDSGLKKYTVGYKDARLRILPSYAVATDPGYSFETRPVRAKMYVDGKLIPEGDPQYVEYFKESVDE